MTLKMALRWKNPDSSADINLRSKGVFAKGFVTGGNIVPSLISLQVDVEPFVLMNFDGAVIVSDANETLPVIDGQINYIVARARFREGDSAINVMQSLTKAAYLADPEIDHLHVVGVVDLSVGGPYAFPPLARVFYESRDIVDQQSRASWRDPVPTFGALPTGDANFNRDGDIRIVLDTGSLYFWNEVLGAWDIFDEVPLRTHRDFEHTNGITGSSAATTLQPDISGTNMRIGAVPVGSGYTANGRFLTSPLVTTDISAAGVGALRGLIQVAFSELGATVSNYRVQKSADILDITYARIIGVSDNHPIGAFTLVYDNIGGTLSWAGGPPVVATTGTAIRLLDPTGVNWIDVDLVGVAPGGLVSDNYDVNANLKNDDHLLVGQWYWDGAATLALGTDKREFGNLGNLELSDDFKDKELHPRWEDLRGTMVYAGGTVTDLGGLNARISGPIVAYVGGVRYVVSGSYNGIVLTNNVTNIIVVDDTGTLAVTTVAPTGVFATVAEVTTVAGAITAIVDTRDPQVVVGQATRDSRLRMALLDDLKWNVANRRLTTERSGSTTNTSMETGKVRATENEFVATTGALLLNDANIVTPVALSNANETNVNFVPSEPNPSIFTSITSNKEVGQFRYGIDPNSLANYEVLILNSLTRIVTVDSGTLYDGRGRRVRDFTSALTVTLPSGVNTSHVIYWDSSASIWTSALLSVGAASSSDIPVAIVRIDGTDAISQILDVRYYANGSSDRNSVFVGGAADEQNFSTLSMAILWLSCFTKASRKRIVVQGAPAGVMDMTDPSYAQVGKLEGLVIEGTTRTNLPSIFWNTLTPMVDFNNLAKNWTFRDVTLSYTGLGVADDDNLAFFKNAGPGLHCESVKFNGGNALTHIAYWNGTNTDFGGGVPTSDRGTRFDNCSASDMFIVDALASNSYFLAHPLVGTTVRGHFSIDGGTYRSATNPGHVMFDQQGLSGVGPQAKILMNGVDIFGIDTSIFRGGGTWDVSPKVLRNCSVTPVVASTVNVSDVVASVDLEGHVFIGETHGLLGARNVTRSVTKSSALVVGHLNVTCRSCEFNVDGGTFKGQSGRLFNTRINLGTTASDVVTLVAVAPSPALIHGCGISKAAGSGIGTQAIINTSGAGDGVISQSSIVSTDNAVPVLTGMIEPAPGFGSLKIVDCTLETADGSLTVFLGGPDNDLTIDDNTINAMGRTLDIARATTSTAEITFTNNVITNLSSAVVIDVSGTTGIQQASSIVIDGNTINANIGTTPVNVGQSPIITVSNNVVVSNTPTTLAVNVGIGDTSESQASAYNNTIVNNNAGVAASTVLSLDAQFSSACDNNMLSRGAPLSLTDMCIISMPATALNSTGTVIGNAVLSIGSINAASLIPIVAGNLVIVVGDGTNNLVS